MLCHVSLQRGRSKRHRLKPRSDGYGFHGFGCKLMVGIYSARTEVTPEPVCAMEMQAEKMNRIYLLEGTG